MRLTWLPEVLRAAGLTVHEYSGWRERGSTSWGPIRGVVCHATAGSRTSTDAGELRTIAVTGSVSAPAPISQLYLSRTGHWHVTASGRCNHVRTGDKGPHDGYGNSALIGIEAQNDNRGEPWSSTMLDSYQRGVAAILRKLGKPASAAVAHREHQSGKSDPHGIDMASFRARVAGLLAGEDDDMQLTDRVDLVQASDVKYSSPTTTVEGVLASTNYYVLQTRNRVLAETAALRTQVTAQTATIEALARAIETGGGNVDLAAIKGHIDTRIAEARADARDAVADLGEGGAAQVRAGADESQARG